MSAGRFLATVVGPEDHLVLVPQERMDPDLLRLTIEEGLPAGLRGRVVVAEMDAYVVRPAAPAATVCLVVRKGVYDQGVAFAGTREDAMEFMRTHKPDEDGYHTWDLREMPLGLPA